MQISVHCQSCYTALFTAKTEEIRFPLQGEMLKPQHSQMFWRPGDVILDIYCPVCLGFPFQYDPSKNGHKGVGGRLLCSQEDGTFFIHDFRNKFDIDNVEIVEIEEKSEEIENNAETIVSSEFPCIICKSKGPYHYRGCCLLVVDEEAKNPSSNEDSIKNLEAWLDKLNNSEIKQIGTVTQKILRVQLIRAIKSRLEHKTKEKQLSEEAVQCCDMVEQENDEQYYDDLQYEDDVQQE